MKQIREISNGDGEPFDLEFALTVIAELARTRRAFTTDDAWAVLPEVGDGRAIANAMIRAERDGLIRNSHIGAYLRGHQAHRRWLSIWLSVASAGRIDDAAQLATSLARQEAR